MTALLFANSAVTLTVVVVLCILLYRQSKKQKKSTVITENMVAEMLKKEGYQVVEVKSSPDWIHFEYDSVKYFIRVCGEFCEIHTGILLQKEQFEPGLTKYLCDNEMRNITCCHLWYDEPNHALLCTAFGIQKSFEHLQSSFYNMMQCIQYGYSAFNDLYQEKIKGGESNKGNRFFS